MVKDQDKTQMMINNDINEDDHREVVPPPPLVVAQKDREVSRLQQLTSCTTTNCSSSQVGSSNGGSRNVSLLTHKDRDIVISNTGDKVRFMYIFTKLEKTFQVLQLYEPAELFLVVYDFMIN